MAVCYFSKWIEARSLKSKQAVEVARFLYEDIICRHGCVALQINDQGREFVNYVSAELHKLTGRTPSPDVQIVGVKQEEISYKFSPLTVAIQRRICNNSGGRLVFKKKSGPSGKINKTFKNTSEPHTVKEIEGDENCIFRALSFAITGEEDQHAVVRSLICDFIACTENIQVESMRNDKVWGTTTEILAAANMFNVNECLERHEGGKCLRRVRGEVHLRRGERCLRRGRGGKPMRRGDRRLRCRFVVSRLRRVIGDKCLRRGDVDHLRRGGGGDDHVEPTA
ncbi:hypothetical protein Pmani_000598 [Petrolisthes manimaculis]|uniref:OTU domain-containing protein n=1 Tax=Petrolisthes manimaculis TaxID=1843537 RepID=A0AAE1USI8_9EUCA|nr:hypothetical protein Pmani_012278 [Petrolisthes manimaculis]KAK4328719.1 hypothetical protein Pmani_000914 [Petrolisthes manimaculis]KAK4329015.1 hypothetical protein Pmani_000598 [Petrolisthes manimaculis]